MGLSTVVLALALVVSAPGPARASPPAEAPGADRTAKQTDRLGEMGPARGVASAEETFPDYRPKLSPDTVLDYRPEMAIEIGALPPAQLMSLPDLMQALEDSKARARENPGRWQSGDIARGADPREYRPSNDELVAAEIGERIARVVADSPPEGVEETLAAAGITREEAEYDRFSFRHADVMGSGRFFFASPPEPVRVTFGLSSSKEAPPDGKPIPFVQEYGDGERWGYKDEKGNVVIEPKFVIADEFSPEGMAAVATEKEWLYIDTTGAVVIRPFIFDNGPDYFSEGLARFTEDGKFGFFDRSGKVVIGPRFDFAFPFSEGLAAVCAGCREEREGEHARMTGGKWGYIDKSGEIAIPLEFSDARGFEGGRARVKLDGNWVTIDTEGSLVE